MGFLTTYRGKIILIAFIGIQIPLLALIYYFCLSSLFFTQKITLGFDFNLISLLLVVLVADLLALTIVAYTLYYLIAPIALNSGTIYKYLQKNRLEYLAADFPNDLNTLIADNDKTLERLERIIQSLIDRDTLTGLPNRELFQTYLQQAISDTAEDRQFVSIVLDLNNLKNINSTLGRQVGDLLLVKVAQRIQTIIAEEDVLARYGGDEFAILRTNIANSDASIVLCDRLLTSLAEPFSLYGREIHCDAKIGVTIYPFDGVTVEQLLQNADTAVYQAKKQKLNSYQFYSPAMGERLKRDLNIKEKLRYALANQEFLIYYQPRINITTNRLVGVEALLRWYNPELGWVSPNEFIPIAEETNLIIPIGEWVLRRACQEIKQWQQERLSSLKVSVNLSACQFKQDNLSQTIEKIIYETDIAPNSLELEVTETVLVEELDRAIAILWELKRKGVSISLDDFGTGYSSLSYLQKLPLDTLKIDRSFITNITSNPDDLVISKAIIALAQSLELNITAEGVETKAQLEYLQSQGCNEVQGYYFSKPRSSQDLTSFLLAYNLQN